MAESASATDPGLRGHLDIKDRAVQNIIVAAALLPDGVLRHSTGLGRLAGRDLPRATVHVAGDHVSADVDVAVEWGRPLRGVAAAVRRKICDALSAHSGLTVDRLDVHVATVISMNPSSRSERTVT